MQIEINRVSPSKLVKLEWNFYISTDLLGVKVHLSSYKELSRETTRHKFRVRRSYARIRPNDWGRDKIALKDVEIPFYVMDELREVAAEKMNTMVSDFWAKHQEGVNSNE